MIISFNRYNGGGGSGSGVTPQYVQRQIDSALTYYWQSGETKDYVDGAVSGISLDGYYTSAQTEDAISAATSGKADKVEVTPNTDTYDGHFPLWNADGVITGEGDKAWRAYLGLNSESYLNFWSQDGNSYSIYAPTTSGTAGEILVSTGSGAPVWSAVTMPDMSEYWTSAQTKAKIDELADELSEVELIASTSINDIKDTMVSSDSINTIWRGTQAQYDDLVLNDQIDNNTLYVIL